MLDEFALVFHLKDVYWSQEGQSSIIAFVMGAAFAGLFLVTSTPFGVAERRRRSRRPGFFFLVACNVLFALITFLKGKPFLGTVGIVIPFVAFVSALRLAQADLALGALVLRSGARAFRRWRAKKLARSTKRFTEGWQARFERGAYNLIGGKPHLPSPE